MRRDQIATLFTVLIGAGILLFFGFLAIKVQSGFAKPPTTDIDPGYIIPKKKAAESPPPIPAYQWYPVEKVTDGDTFVVSVGEKSVVVRLIGLDAPEFGGEPQCYAQEAADEARKLLSGSSVRLETDPSQDLYDAYGRLLAYAYVPASSKPEGILMNEYMIAHGFGEEYTFKVPYAKQTQFREVETSARELKKGMWGESVCQ